MDYFERLKEANALFEEDRYKEADAIYEEVARATLNPRAVNMTIATKSVLAAEAMEKIDAGESVSDEDLDVINSALEWLEIEKHKETFMASSSEDMEEERVTLFALKGKMLYLQGDSNCETPLQRAVALGDNDSRFYLALHDKKMAEKITSENGAEDELAKYYWGKMCYQLEDYLENCENEGITSGDGYETARAMMADAYENGTGVPKDPEKAKTFRV